MRRSPRIKKIAETANPKQQSSVKKVRNKVQRKELAVGKAAEAARAKRQKIKTDPKLYAIYCQKEHERYLQRKKDGKRKLVNELTEREKRARRKKQRIWKRNSRLKQKTNQNNNKSTEQQHPCNVSKQTRCEQTRRKKNGIKCYKENTKLRSKIRKLEKTVQTLLNADTENRLEIIKIHHLL